MKPKQRCINCGARDYKAIKGGFKCEYCGTEYEIEMPERPNVEVTMFPSMMSTCLAGTVVIQNGFADIPYYKRRYGL